MASGFSEGCCSFDMILSSESCCADDVMLSLSSEFPVDYFAENESSLGMRSSFALSYPFLAASMASSYPLVPNSTPFSIPFSAVSLSFLKNPNNRKVMF